MEKEREILLPAPTPWPVVLALGLALVATALVTTAALAVLGGVLILAGGVGWFFDVLPVESHVAVAVREEALPVTTARPEVERPELSRHRRLRLPVAVPPMAAGMRGGAAGSVAMAVIAMLYGWLSHRSVWYPVNLLGAVIFARNVHITVVELTRFNTPLFLIAVAIHVPTSVLVGLLYGAMLPMLPRNPILLGGGIAPVLWSGLVYSVLGFVNPFMSAQINWGWFVLSQIAYGLAAGAVVLRHARIPVSQSQADGGGR